MTRITPAGYIKRTILSTFAIILTVLYPSAASFAQDAPTSDTTAGQSQTVPADQPTGTDATTYHYNASTDTWENDHYIWDPVTRKTTPKDTLPYSYNPATGKWDTTEWRYNGTTGKWEPNTVSVAQPPAGSQTVGGPTGATPAATTATTSASSSTTATTPATSVPTLSPSATPPTTNTSSSYFDGFYNAAISNTITSTAVSGNAQVRGNLAAGSATTGNATASTNVFNMLQSTAGFENLGSVNTFVTNIDGDVYGDFFIDPSQLGNLQPAAANGLDSNTQVNIAHDNSITNDLTLNARSGNATVSGNNTAGDATTGNANAVANLVNLINSSIAANQSFIGTLNINGNLNGDILLPPDVLQTLLASNAPTTTVTLSAADRANLDASLGSDQSITNNITTAATTGNATVTGNNSAGSATTGNGATNITVLNLTGRQIVGDNSLLVFVNVLGKWVGAIIDAPQGTTAAALGSGITNNKSATLNGSLDTNDNNTITNNIDLTAQSGDATVERNLHAGNATSGNATTSANISNVENSHVSLGGWFGMLFINVFGSWFGSFGMDTDAGGKAPQNTSNNDVKDSTASAGSTQGARVFRFTATTPGGTRQSAATEGSITSEVVTDTPATSNGHVLGAETTAPSPHAGTSKQTNLSFPLGALSLGGGLFAAERAFATRPRHGRH